MPALSVHLDGALLAVIDCKGLDVLWVMANASRITIGASVPSRSQDSRTALNLFGSYSPPLAAFQATAPKGTGSEAANTPQLAAGKVIVSEARKFLIDNGVPDYKIHTKRTVLRNAKSSQIDFLLDH